VIVTCEALHIETSASKQRAQKRDYLPDFSHMLSFLVIQVDLRRCLLSQCGFRP